MRTALHTLAFAMTAALAWPQGPAPAAARGEGLLSLRQALLDASVDTRVAVVATHPDDPYRGVCLLLRRLWGCDVTVVIATRGEGGQNAVGPELGPELAEIRTRETLAAADLLDVKVRFLDLPDFGYARTAAEALDRWRDQAPFARLRAVLDELRPDLVITPHAPGEAHGQKRAMLNLLAECITGLPAPHPRFFRGPAGDESPTVVLPLDVPDPLRGRTYQEQAYEALLQHRTQQPYRPLAEAEPTPLLLRVEGETGGSLFEGLRGLWSYGPELVDWHSSTADAGRSLSWLRQRLEDLPEIPARREIAEDPVAVALELLPVMQALHRRAPQDSDVAQRLGRRIAALGRAVLAGAVVRMTWEGSEEWPSSEPRISVPLRVWNGGRWPVSVRVRGLANDASGMFRLAGGTDAVPGLDVARGAQGRIPLAVERVEPPVPGAIDLALAVEVRVCDAAITTAVSRQVQSLLPLAMSAEPQARFLVAESGGDIRLSVRFRKSRAIAVRGVLAMRGPIGVSLLPEADGDETPILVDLPVGQSSRQIAVRLRVAPWPAERAAGRAPSRILDLYVAPTAGAPAPPEASCRVRIDPVQMRVPSNLHIGIVRGPDTTVEDTLRGFGLDVHPLDPRSLAGADLDELDTILVDSRALLQRAEDLLPQVPRFVAFARRGGHLVVLYHKDQEFNAAETGVLLAPYPLVLGRERITREDAPVEVLLGDHPLMVRPNQLQPRDWDGWVQERGLYFPEVYDQRYQELLALEEVPVEELPSVRSSDAETAFEVQRGSLLYASTGTGSYVYCALVIHRQLRAFHPGAARLLVNLVTPRSWTAFR